MKKSGEAFAAVFEMTKTASDKYKPDNTPIDNPRISRIIDFNHSVRLVVRIIQHLVKIRGKQH